GFYHTCTCTVTLTFTSAWQPNNWTGLLRSCRSLCTCQTHANSHRAPCRLPPRPSCRLVPFFFQAEDGIRDFHVTGVQTCALPILDRASTTLSPPNTVK